ncbi:branched-chain amino acid ABC transporter permease [Microvirga antarctica]|uniref:branched-chain amino acid ABC transporter permease n=1 Tax=Microvirga antarctica TaxID=2819233 RepID=UPI001B316FB4|nr:branched-chain amino acid ABC transporter permease [Microvirga antarctica]
MVDTVRARSRLYKALALVVLLVIAILLPLVLKSNYQLGIAHQALIFIILALGYDVLLGFTGLLSFGHIGLFAIGAYTSAILVMSTGAPFLVGLLGAAVLTGFIGFLIAIPALRIKGHYLTLLTLALGEVIRLVIRSADSLTHGSSGLSGIPRPDIFGYSFRQATPLYYLLLFFAVLAILFVWRLKISRFGRAFMSIRDAEIGAEVCGVNTSAMKMMSFAISAVLAGIAGSLYAHTMRFISPEFFGLGLTTTLLAMVLIGGRGTVVGPVVGAALLIVLPEALRFVKDYYLIVFGIAIWLCVIGMPDGLAGLGRRLLKRARLIA